MITKIKLIALIVFLLSNLSIYAQSNFTVSGFVKDSLSAEPLIGVAVVNSHMRGAITNEYGFFSITLSDPLVELSFTHLGYKTGDYNAVIDKDIELNMFLAPSNLEIGEARIQASTNKLTTPIFNDSVRKYADRLLDSLSKCR